MPAWLLVACMALATWRATRLVTEDAFPPVRWLRERIVEGGPEWLGDLVMCSWCASVWLAAGVVALTDALTSVPRPLLVFGAVAALSPLLSVAVERLEQADEEDEEDEAEDEMATLTMSVGANGRVEV